MVIEQKLILMDIANNNCLLINVKNVGYINK